MRSASFAVHELGHLLAMTHRGAPGAVIICEVDCHRVMPDTAPENPIHQIQDTLGGPISELLLAAGWHPTPVIEAITNEGFDAFDACRHACFDMEKLHGEIGLTEQGLIMVAPVIACRLAVDLIKIRPEALVALDATLRGMKVGEVLRPSLNVMRREVTVWPAPVPAPGAAPTVAPASIGAPS